MASIWPPALPQTPLNEDFTRAKGSALIRTSMDNGPAKVRRRQSRAIDLLSVSFILDEAQVGVLDVFIDETLAGGVRAFEFPRPCGGDNYLVRIVPQGEEELYTISTVSNKYSVTLTLEVLP